MLFSPLFRVADVVTIRSDLSSSEPEFLLWHTDDSEYDPDYGSPVSATDRSFAGESCVVTNALGLHFPYPEVHTSRSPHYAIVDTMTVGGNRIAHYLNCL